MDRRAFMVGFVSIAGAEVPMITPIRGAATDGADHDIFGARPSGPWLRVLDNAALLALLQDLESDGFQFPMHCVAIGAPGLKKTPEGWVAREHSVADVERSGTEIAYIGQSNGRELHSAWQAEYALPPSGFTPPPSRR